MGKSIYSPKDMVRNRSEGLCERCHCILTSNHNGVPDGDTARTIHHRQPRRCGGRDSVVVMVNLCVGCHRWIHDNEKIAVKEGWIVIGRYAGNVPFLSWRGWVLPRPDGSLTLLDFNLGRAFDLPRPQPRRRVAHRQRHRRAA